MARKARIHYPGAVYHVMLRGNGGRDIFFDESDRIRFYDLLEEGVKRFDVRIPAFCLMTNHVHPATLTDLGKRLGRDLSSLNQAVNRLRKRMETHPSLARSLDRVRQDLSEIHRSQA